MVFLAGHFSANSALAADFATNLITSDLAASTTDFTNSIVFSAGCHSGYSIVNRDAITGATFTLDWAQAFAQKQATLIAGTGYQYGDTDFIEYSERLYLNFAKRAARGDRARGSSARRWSRRSSTIWRRRPTSAVSTRRRSSNRRCTACRCWG